MEVEIVSRAILASNVEPNISVVKLSENDNGMVRVYTQFCFFYCNKNENPDFMREETLQASLKNVLVHFPELTGRMRVLDDGGLEVLCENQGVEWINATTSGSMKDLSAENFAQQKLPNNILAVPTPEEGFLLRIQYTKFLSDNSVLVSIALHHSVADGHGVVRFLKCWSETSMGKSVDQPLSDRSVYSGNGQKPKYDHPELNLGSSLSAEQKMDFQSKMTSLVPNLTARVFCVTRSSLDQLKIDTISIQKKLGLTTIVSTNDAISALLWRSALLPRDISPDRTVMILMACNGRGRSNPKLPESYIGNSNFYVRVELEARELLGPDGLGIGAAKIRQGVDAINSEWIQSSLNWVAQQKNKSDIIPGFNFLGDEDYSITSWAGFQIYEIDFGWGSPDRFRVPVKAFNNLALLFPPSPGNDEMEVTLGLSKDNMDALLQDDVFMKYFSFVG